MTERTAAEAARPPTAAEALRWGRCVLAGAGAASADLDAQVLLADVLGVERWRLFSGHDGAVGRQGMERFRRLVEERASGTPLAYLRGKKEFWSLEIQVDSRVLVPRPETEGVVEAALERVPSGGRVLDVGTGSGNILIALAVEIDGEGWVGVDISAPALEVAGLNVAAHGLAGRIRLLQSDLFDGLDGDCPPFDAVVSYPPYIPSADLDSLPADVRLHEPPSALDGGADGLGVIRRLLREAPDRLREGGSLIVEVGDGQAPAVVREARETGRYREVETRTDLAGKERIVVARRG